MEYGASVNGDSDTELGKLRFPATAGVSPRPQGRSLAGVLVLKGHPAARAAFAPIAQWAHVAWRTNDVHETTSRTRGGSPFITDNGFCLSEAPEDGASSAGTLEQCSSRLTDPAGTQTTEWCSLTISASPDPSSTCHIDCGAR